MNRAHPRRIAALSLSLAILCGAAAVALPAPSKTAEAQSLAAREADLATIRAALAQQEVAAALAAQGLSSDQVELRLAQLSPQEAQQLAGQIEQLQAAGLQPPRYIWILLGVLIAVVILATLF